MPVGNYGGACGTPMTLSGAAEGLVLPATRFFQADENGIFNAVFDSDGPGVFTLSIGMGSIAIFGSYIDKKHSLTGEAVRVTVLDTGVALIAGLIIFPACFTFSIQPDSGPNLIFCNFAERVCLPYRVAGSGAFFFVFFIVCGTVHSHCRV